MSSATLTGKDELLRKVMDDVAKTLTDDLRTVLSETLEKQLTSALSKALLESELYRRISNDMRSGLKKIYKEINTAANTNEAGDPAVSNQEKTTKLFHEASEQLATVLTQTENATVTIMEIVEKHLDAQAEVASIIESVSGEDNKDKVDRLKQLSAEIEADMNNIMVSLSFQDLTGQRIKLAVKALQEIESTVVEMFLSTGLLIQAFEEEPDSDLDAIEQKTREQVSGLKQSSVLESSLKGPDETASQQKIDDLLSQLGM